MSHQTRMCRVNCREFGESSGVGLYFTDVPQQPGIALQPAHPGSLCCSLPSSPESPGTPLLLPAPCRWHSGTVAGEGRGTQAKGGTAPGVSVPSEEREQTTHLCLQKAVRNQTSDRLREEALLVSAMWGTSVISHQGKAPWWLCSVLWSLGRERGAAGVCGTLVTVSLQWFSPAAPHGQWDLCCVSILSQFPGRIKDGESSDKQRVAG